MCMLTAGRSCSLAVSSNNNNSRLHRKLHVAVLRCPCSLLSVPCSLQHVLCSVLLHVYDDMKGLASPTSSE